MSDLCKLVEIPNEGAYSRAWTRHHVSETRFWIQLGERIRPFTKAEATELHRRLTEWLDGQKAKTPIDLRSLKVGDTVQFDDGNALLYYQDMDWHTGVTHELTFLVDDIIRDTGVRLVAPGYGGKPYSNGKILVYFDQEQPKSRDDGAWRL